MSPEKNIVSRLQENVGQFSKSQKLIGDYLLAHPDRVAFLTAVKLARELGVSESTVVRFAVALGYEGYPEMQRDVQEIIRHKLSAVDRMKMSVRDNNLLETVIHTDMQNLALTLEEISYEGFAAAVSAIAGARNICVVGLRSAAAPAQFLGFYLDLLLRNTRVIRDSETVFEGLTTLDGQDLVIGISFPHYTRRTVEILGYARERGAKIVAITDSVLSPLARYADVTLTARSDINSFIDSFVAPLSIINALIVAVSEKDREGVLHTLAGLDELWSRFKIYYP
jgi:DNA-binding MurR/RpiR family transcriptional regulator